MAHENGTVKTKDNPTPESNAGSVIIKQEASDTETEVKLESELMLEDDHEDEYHLTEVAEKKSPLRLISESMVLGRTVQIILERCDADNVHNLNSEQRSVSRVSENCSNAELVRIKVENEIDMMENEEMETCVTDTDDSVNAVKVNDKQSDIYFHANASGKIEDEEGLMRITRELVVSCASRNPGSRDVVKQEEEELQSDFNHYSAVECRNEKMSNNLNKETCSLWEDNTVKTSVEESLGDYLRSNARVKMEEEKEEKVVVTSRLVSNLPEQFKCVGRDEKPLLKIVKCEESEADVGSKIQSDFKHPPVSGAANTVIDKIFLVVLETKSKVSPKINAKNKSTVKRYSCSECSYRCHSKTDMTEHMRVHTGERPHECKECPKKFKTQRQLNTHMITHTNKRLFKCAHCTAKFKTKDYLICHLRTHSDGRLYSCTECSAKFKARGDLTVHLVTHSSEKRFECGHCNLRFKKKDFLRRHIRSHFEGKSYSCSLCGAKFRYSSDLKSHLRMKHTSERLFECTQCGARFKSKSNLGRHFLTHSDEKPFRCPHCPSTFRQSGTLKIHIIAKHTNEKLYACAHCSKKFKQKQEVAQHMITHSNEKPHSCPQCLMTFKRKYNLKMHTRIHVGEKPYSCPQCPANFCQQNELKYHLAVHSDERPFACDQCPAKFKRSKDLKRHTKKHLTMRLFGCLKCSLKFKTQEAVNEHMKYVHVGIDKKHVCSQCSYKTHKLSHLKRHMLVHSDEKPFSCDQCLKKFRQLFNLKHHNATVHMNVKPFICDKCSTTWKTKEALRNHLERHSVENRYACNKCSYTFPSLRSLKIHSSVHTGERKYTCGQCLAKFTRKCVMRTHILRVHMS